jgi:hypothetical protein
MTNEDERDREARTNDTKKSAAEGKGGASNETPQDDTDSTTWDTAEHSDAPGPFGTG